MRIHVVLSMLVPLITSASVAAGEYQFAKGTGIEVCEAYWKILKQNHDPVPMACERAYKPYDRDFTSLGWHEINPNTIIGLLERAIYYTNTTSEGVIDSDDQGSKLTEARIHEVVQDIRPYVNDKRRKIYLASVDIFSDGKPRKILAIRSDYCGPNQTKGMTSTWLYVVRDDLSDIVFDDQNKLDIGHDRPTVEMFKGKPYLEQYEPDDNWQTLLTGNGALSIWDPRKLSATDDESQSYPLCEFHFSNMKKKN